MALREINVENLSIEIKENGRERVVTTIVRFTAGADDFVISIPRVTADRIRFLLEQFLLSASNDEQIRTLVAEKNFRVELRANGLSADELGELVTPIN